MYSGITFSITMLPKVQCDECGDSISNKYLVFKHLCAKMKLDKAVKNNILPAFAMLSEPDDEDLSPKIEVLLDKLGVKMICCRIRMISCIEFNTVY